MADSDLPPGFSTEPPKGKIDSTNFRQKLDAPASPELPPGFSSRPPEQQPKIVMKGGGVVGSKESTVASGGVAPKKVDATPPIPNDPKWKTVSDFLNKIIPPKSDLLSSMVKTGAKEVAGSFSPDYLSDKLWAAGKLAGSVLDGMLTPAGPLDPLNAVPNLPQLRNDIKAYLLEGGNMGGPEGTPGLKGPQKPTSVPGASAAPIARAAGEKAVSDALGSSVTANRAPNEASIAARAGQSAVEKALDNSQTEPGNLSGVRPGQTEAQPASSGAAATPIGRLAEENIRNFEEANKAPGMKQRLQDGADYMRQYFDDSEKAKANIQRNQGSMQRVGSQATHAMASFKNFVGEMNIDEQIDLLKWIQKPEAKLSKGLQLSTQADKFVSTFHDWMHTYAKKIAALSDHDKMEFRKNYISQLWRQPKGAMKFINEYGAKRGSGYFTNGRVFDDYEAGIHAGFAPVTTNPVEIFSRYIENASKYIASHQSKDDAFSDGMMVYRTPKNAPQGWVPVKSVMPVAGQLAYAPPGYARVFDNFNSSPAQMAIPGTKIDLLQTAASAANKSVGFKLSLSGFHPSIVTMEGIMSGVANGITKAKNGRPIAGFADVITAPFKPITSYAKGRQMQQAYLDGTWGTPEYQRIVRALTDAGYDPLNEHGLADEYRMSRLPGFIKGWQKGVPATAGGPLKMASRAIGNTMEPTFQYYVPWLKNQAVYDIMKTYLDAHPNLTDKEFAAYGSKASKIVDDRFGEVNRNNIFWNATAKRAAQSALTSWSFTLGQARQAMGFAWDAARVPDKVYRKLKGTLPDTEEIWTDRMSYAIAVPIVTAIVDGLYQYLKTGKVPESPQDLMKPQTGGTDPSTGQPERAMLPNFANSYENIWKNGIGGELYNKASPLWQTLVAEWGNSDYRGLPVRDPNDTVPKQIQQMAQFALDNAITPIGIGNITEAKAGTNISSLERLFGIRAAGMQDTAPEQTKQTIAFKDAERWYEKRKSDVNQIRAQKGLGPLRINRYERSRLIEKYMKNPQSDPLQSYGGAHLSTYLTYGGTQ